VDLATILNALRALGDGRRLHAATADSPRVGVSAVK